MAVIGRFRPAATVLVVCLAAGLAEAPSGRAAEAAGARLVVDCGNDCWPAAFAFTPSGKQIFYLERFTGEIHRYTLGSGADRVWASVGPVDGDGERGALGIAVDPRWDSGKKKRRWKRRWIYVFITNESPLENRVDRLRKSRRGNDVKTERLVTISITTGSNHNAGVIHFGPDGKLYVVSGDQALPSRSQDLADPAGKVLRLDRNGSRPGDNPLPGSTAFSFGHRNSFGFTFDPVAGGLWQTENGPSCDDEVNLVVPGGNYGWGSGSTCPNTSTEGPSPIPPEHEWTPPIVPTGAAFCKGCGLGESFEGDLLVGVYGSGEILDFSLDAQRDDVASVATLYDHPSGVLAVERRPNGQIYFSDDGGIYLLTA
ncbi:MAG: PQQ-dependent sugar dehydrogenase [Nocardioidaceae bacterium]